MGEAVVKALNFRTGFTHMEWFKTPSGEAVFGEIAARPPGAHLVDLINYASDIDVFTGWAEAICHGHFTQTVDRKYNAAWIYKRAEGEGVFHKIEGLAPLMAELGEHVMLLDLLPIGAPRRNWKQNPRLRRDDHRAPPRPRAHVGNRRSLRNRAQNVCELISLGERASDFLGEDCDTSPYDVVVLRIIHSQTFLFVTPRLVEAGKEVVPGDDENAALFETFVKDL